jgi:hypothetical protein
MTKYEAPRAIRVVDRGRALAHFRDFELDLHRRQGRRDRIVALLRNPNHELTIEAREFAADLIEGKIKRAKHRPPSPEVIVQNRRIANHVAILRSKGWKDEAAVKDAADQYKTSVGSVRAAWRICKDVRAWLNRKLDEDKATKKAKPELTVK